jgi:hypothetical protein
MRLLTVLFKGVERGDSVMAAKKKAAKKAAKKTAKKK